jgi:hypothetical protein
LFPDVQKMLNADATGLAILLLLALGTFVAGIHIPALEVCILGFVMALFVPAIAWIEEAALIVLLGCDHPDWSGNDVLVDRNQKADRASSNAAKH